MREINLIDKNFNVNNINENIKLKWMSADEDCFSKFGVMKDKKGYFRMNEDAAKTVSEDVFLLSRNTSGGRILFETDSSVIAVRAKGDIQKIPTMSLSGMSGLDLYVYDENEFKYYRTFLPKSDSVDGYEQDIEFQDRKSRKLLIHFPLYMNVESLHIGLDADASIKKFNPYKKMYPIVYYGSSITQGGCASRPGNSYPAIVSQKSMTDFICLGFSGNAHGESEMAEYIANLPMSVFVMDYDQNDCWKPDVLKERHSKFYKIIREKNPELPIIIMSTTITLREPHEKSRLIVMDTYNKAKANGDNVYFIDGKRIFQGEFENCATVDGTHPNDFGFVKMAETVLGTLNEIGIFRGK